MGFFSGSTTGTNQTSGSTYNTSGQQTQNYQDTTGQNITKPIEPDYFSAFRSGLIGPYQQLLAKAQQPVYGEAEQASYLNNLNTMANAGLKTLAGNISSRGGSLDSGAFAAGAGQIEAGREGSAAQYALQTPGLNKAAYQKNVGDVLGMGMNFAGRAPIGQQTDTTGHTGQVGSTNIQSVQDFSEFLKSTQKSNPSLFSSIMNMLGGGLGIASGLGFSGFGGGGSGSIPGGDPNAAE